MITFEQMASLVRSYSPEITIAALGSHSALDILDGAKDEGFRTLAVCQKGREKPYLKYKRIIDRVIVLENFSQILNKDCIDLLIKEESIFVPHRAFSTYVGYDGIEGKFPVPIFGNRWILRAEERNEKRNQYYLLEKAGIRMPLKFSDPSMIDRPVIVKVPEAKRSMERAFFTASSPEQYRRKASLRIEQSIINREALEKAVIEELVLGTYLNFNYFYSPLDDEVEFLGIDRRLQTNLNDFTSLPARDQLEIDVELQNIEIGHLPATVRESMLEKVFDIGEKFANAVRQEYPPGMIGPFALQSAVTKDLEIVVYDVSPRVPGSPILATTSPYSKYRYGYVVGTGRRIAMEIRKAAKQRRLDRIVT